MIGFDCVVNFISYVCLGLLPDAGYIFGAILIALTVVSAFSWKTVSLYCENAVPPAFRTV